MSSSTTTGHAGRTPPHWLFVPITEVFKWWSQQNNAPPPTILEVRLLILRPSSTPQSSTPPPSTPPSSDPPSSTPSTVDGTAAAAPPTSHPSLELLLLLPTAARTYTIPARCFVLNHAHTPSSIISAASSMLQHAIEERRLTSLQFLDINLRLPYSPVMKFHQSTHPQPARTLRIDLALFTSSSSLDTDSVINTSPHDPFPPRGDRAYTALRWTPLPTIPSLALHPDLGPPPTLAKSLTTRLRHYTNLHNSLRGPTPDLTSLTTLVRLAIQSAILVREVETGSAIPFALVAVRSTDPFSGLWIMETASRQRMHVPEGQVACIVNQSAKAGTGGGWVEEVFVVVGEVVGMGVGLAGPGSAAGAEEVVRRRLVGGLGSGDGGSMEVNWIWKTARCGLRSMQLRGRAGGEREVTMR